MARKRVRPKDALISLYQRFGVVYVDRVSGFPVRGMKLNPFYVDGMRISTSPEGLKLITEMMPEKSAILNSTSSQRTASAEFPMPASWPRGSKSAS